MRYHSTDLAQRGPAEDLAVDIDLWLSEDKQVYFLCEGPGIGRSPTAVELCARCYSKKPSTARLCASFFFAFDNRYLESSCFALSSISYQLLAPELRSDVLKQFRIHLYRGDERQLRLAAERLLHEALVAASPTAQTPIVLVIDAIDRCMNAGEVPLFLRHLLACAREFPWLRLFFSARPRPNVMAVLAHPTYTDLVHHRQLGCDLQYWNGDSHQYIRYTMPRVRACSDIVYHHPGILREAARHIDDDFAFAHIAMKYLDISYTDPEAALHEIAKLFVLPPGQSRLHALFERQLRLAFSTLPTNQHEVLYVLLRSMAYAGHALTPESIASYALHVSPDEIVLMVDDLRTILSIDHNGEIVPLDISFYKFLLIDQPSQSSHDHYRMDRAVHLASICLTALLMANPVTTIFSTFPATSLLPESDVLTSHDSSPFLVLWPNYLSQVKIGSRGQPSITEQLYAFVPSPQLALYAWVTDPIDTLRAARIVTRYITRLVCVTVPLYHILIELTNRTYPKTTVRRILVPEKRSYLISMLLFAMSSFGGSTELSTPPRQMS